MRQRQLALIPGHSSREFYVYIRPDAIDPKTNEMLKGTIEEETEQVLKNIGAILKEVGLTYENIVKTTVYLLDLNDFVKMNDVYARFFKTNPPARAAVQVSSLPKGAKIEIEAVAYFDKP